ncbi:MAG TPA: ribonuclease HII [Usitatibacter sp.]|jgi:ribonuclease HII|nr:ribonuclease HII [Usitatibacter sp.]
MARVEELSVDEIRKRYVERKEPVSQQVLNRLQRDRRQGVQRLYASLRKRFERERDERARLDAMLHFEKVLWRSGVRDIAGVDEAGMAPLAGPVVAAAVMFPPETYIEGINDSKQVDAPTRERLAEAIRGTASGVSVGIATVEEIDAINIYHAGLLAMRRAVEGLPRAPQHVLVDARTVPGIPMPQNAFNKGDGLNFTIAAASIIAKTTRDAMMTALDREYPGYGLAGHKGYPTAEHRDAVVRLGPSAIHRMSFPVMHELQGEWSKLFYELRQRVWDAATREVLTAFESDLQLHAKTLPEVECKKLRLMVTRKWKVLVEA